MWWPSLDWKQNLARDNHPTIDLNLMWNQSTCLNASITQSKFPIMMQTQIRATNMRWGGMTSKSSQPCLVPMSNTVIGHSWLSHYVAKQKCDSLDWKRNLTRDNCPTIDLNLMEISRPALKRERQKNHNKIRQHETICLPSSSVHFCNTNFGYQ